MVLIRRISVLAFMLSLLLALFQCGRPGTPGGGPKDETPPQLIRAIPENRSTQFKSESIRLYFDEYIKLQDVQNQLIVSPPLKYQPEIRPQGSASKFVEITFKDTLLENTTYTLNFGQSVVDNNEGNPYNFLTYVFSTGDYIDSLSLQGAVADGFNRTADNFISVMLYEIDSAYTDSVPFQQPPYYLTNTLDSAVIFKLENLKAGKYRLIALKDEGKNNIYDPVSDKIGFLADTITLPSDSIYLLRMFREIPEYNVIPPAYAASNKIIFGYQGKDQPIIESLTTIPDSVRYRYAKEPEKDSVNFWFTPWKPDSVIFTLRHPEIETQIDTFTVKPLNLAADSLSLSWTPRRALKIQDSVYASVSLPIQTIDTSRIQMRYKDTIPLAHSVRLDTALNRIYFGFEKNPNESYVVELLPGALTDFFGTTNDSLINKLTTGSPADYGELRLSLAGELSFPLLVELINDRGDLIQSRTLQTPREIEFPSLDPGNYRIRVVFDSNGNGIWDTGNFLEKIQPERVVYFPAPIEMRANWEDIRTFTISN